MTANVTNTVALVFNGIGSVWGSRPELTGQGPWLKRILPVAAVGGATGAALLLSTPAEGFEKIVPILLGVARSRSSFRAEATAGGEGRRPSRPHRHTLLESSRSSLICIYGGYFGAAAGVLLLALLLRAGHATLAHANASKNVFPASRTALPRWCSRSSRPCTGPPSWRSASAAWSGPGWVPSWSAMRPQGPLKVLIGAAGVALAVKLGIDAYS